MDPMLEAFRKVVTVDWPKRWEDEGKAHLLKVAREGHEKTLVEQRQRSGGVEPVWSAFANTPGNTDLNNVKLPGPIVYRYQYGREYIQKALASLRLKSPVDSGLYQKSHYLYVNGVLTDDEAVGALNPNDTIMIVNTVMYARRIEVGKTKGGRSFVVQVPNKIYERVAAELTQKYGKIITVKYTFVELPGTTNTTMGRTGRFSVRRRSGNRKRGKRSQSMRYPAIVIKSKLN